MLHESSETNKLSTFQTIHLLSAYHRHIQSFYCAAKLIWRKLIFVRDIEVKTSRYHLVGLLHVVQLLNPSAAQFDRIPY